MRKVRDLVPLLNIFYYRTLSGLYRNLFVIVIVKEEYKFLLL